MTAICFCPLTLHGLRLGLESLAPETHGETPQRPRLGPYMPRGHCTRTKLTIILRTSIRSLFHGHCLEKHRSATARPTLVKMDKVTGRRQRGYSANHATYLLENKSSSSENESNDRATTSTPPSKSEKGITTQGTKSRTSTPRRPRHITILRSWWLECLTCILVFAVLVAMIVTLYKQQNKPLQTYGLGITINSLTAVYTIIIKSWCVFIVSEGLFKPANASL